MKSVEFLVIAIIATVFAILLFYGIKKCKKSSKKQIQFYEVQPT